MDRYLIAKGWEGFCDRLQCVSNGIDVALHFNRILLVDWTDRIWTHDSKDFYTYFDIVDVPYIVSSKQIPESLGTYPGFWKNGVGLCCDEWVYGIKDHLAFDPNVRNHHEPVWVHPGIGHRYFDFCRLSKHVRFTAEVGSEVSALVRDIPTDLPVVHLRGTDRAIPTGRWEELRRVAPIAVVVSDDARLVERWMTESPDSIVMSDTMAPANAPTLATHKTDSDTLRKRGLSKHQLNIRLLADFVIIARAKAAYAINEESVFFTMARLLGQCDGVERLFQVAPEPETVMSRYTGFEFYIRREG